MSSPKKELTVQIFFTDGESTIHGHLPEEDAHTLATNITNGEGFNWETDGKIIYYPAHMVQEVHVY